MRVWAVINQKGGVGKSTTAAALASGLARNGARVLAVDLDAQGNLTFNIRGTPPPEVGAFDVLAGSATMSRAVLRCAGLDLLPSSPGLFLSDTAITQTGKEYRLRDALQSVSSRYDYAVIDTPPALGVLTVNALTACTLAIVPAQADPWSLHGVAQLGSTIDAVRRYCNPGLTVAGIVLTRYNARTVIARDMRELMQQTAARLGCGVFSASIRECVAVKEAQATQTAIFDYEGGKTNAAADYAALLSEVLKIEEEITNERL